MMGYFGASGVTHGWTAEFPGNASYSVEEIHYGGDARFHSGANAMSHSTEGNGESISKQVAIVVPDTDYTASVYVKGWDYSGDATGFGAAGTTDCAGLWIREYGLGGNLTADHGEIDITDPVDYTLLSMPFHTSPTTYRVEFILRSLIHCRYDKGRTSFDDALLDGPAGVLPHADLTGTVTLDGSAVTGATVTAGGKSAVTGGDGVYTIDGIELTGAASAINVHNPGYMSDTVTLFSWTGPTRSISR